MIIDRNELIEEYKLRLNLRKTIKKVYEAKRLSERKSNLEERKLRYLIKKMISESDEKTPHKSTGINVLEDLLKKIVPQLEQEYKKLTTSEDQRESFRSHIINAVQNALAPTKASAEAETEEEKEKAIDINEEEIEINVGGEDDLDTESPDDEAFIDIDDSGADGSDELSDEEKFGAGTDGDETGRNMAFHAFERVEKSIIDAYGLLSADEDRELFYDYLLTNLKLYFDKFEDELASVLPEPTTSEYETEKDSQEADNEEGEEAASDEGGDELDLGDDAEADDELDLDL